MARVVDVGLIIALAVVVGPGAVLVYQWATGKSNAPAGRHRRRPLARHASPPDDELAPRRGNAMSTQTPEPQSGDGGPEQVVHVDGPVVDDDGRHRHHPEPTDDATDEQTDEQTEDESSDSEDGTSDGRPD